MEGIHDHSAVLFMPHVDGNRQIASFPEGIRFSAFELLTLASVSGHSGTGDFPPGGSFEIQLYL